MMRRVMEARWISGKDVRPGDQLSAYRYRETSPPQPFNSGPATVVAVRAGSSLTTGGSFNPKEGTFWPGSGTTLWLAERESWGDAVKQDKGFWNGSCKLCGGGTYTGFTSVEHEGGSCEKLFDAG